MTRRLVISYLILTMVILAVLEIPLGLAFADDQLDELTAEIQQDAFAIAGFVEESLEDPAEHQGSGPAEGESIDLGALADAYESDSGGRVVIIENDGLAVADSSPPAEGERYFDTRPEVEAALVGEVSAGTRTSATLGRRIVFVAVPVASGGTVHGAVRISYPTSEIDRRVQANWVRLAGIALITLLAAGGIGVALARSVSAPISDLQRAATALGHGDLDVRASVSSGPPEVRALAREFNDMADRLEDLIEAQDAFAADASHQLRSPLTALQLRLENLEAVVPDSERGDVEAAHREVSRLSRLVDGLLSLARADRVSSTVSAAPVPIADVVEDRRSAWSPVADEDGIALTASVPGVPVALVTEDRLVQVLDNLIANAIDASPSGSTITLTAGLLEPGNAAPLIELHVIDEGPGLTADQRGHAFDRLWRASQEGGRLGGSGLGLAIVRKLVRADGGRVELLGADGGGLDARVTYAAAPI